MPRLAPTTSATLPAKSAVTLDPPIALISASLTEAQLKPQLGDGELQAAE